MASQVNSPASYLANTALSAFRAVALSTNLGVGLNPNSAVPLGYTQHEVASGEYVAIRFHTEAGTHKVCVTGVPITAGSTVLFAAANGKLSSSGTITVATAHRSPGANDEIIDVLPA